MPIPRTGVLCAGSIVVDVEKVIDAYPEPEGLAVIREVSLSTGGPALNMAVDLRMLGAPWPVGVGGVVGDDERGRFILEECRRVGVDCARVAVTPGAVTSFTDAMIEAIGGRRTFFQHAGASDLFTASHVDLARSTARVLHLGAPGIHAAMDAGDRTANGWSQLLQAARERGMRTNLELVSVDRERIAELVVPCLPHLDSLIVNEYEASAVVGRTVPSVGVDGSVDWRGAEAVALDLVAAGVRQMAVVHFPAGCVAATADGRTWRQGSVRVPRELVRNTTGAGDAFASGVLFGLHEQWPTQRCLHLGVAAAGLSVRSPHTSDGIQPVERCLAVAEHDGFRPTD